jgi:hypothetical protein
MTFESLPTANLLGLSELRNGEGLNHILIIRLEARGANVTGARAATAKLDSICSFGGQEGLNRSEIYPYSLCHLPMLEQAFQSVNATSAIYTGIRVMAIAIAGTGSWCLAIPL